MKAKSIYTVMLGVFLLASCNNEDTPLQAGQDSDAPAMNLPEGTFVVDYTASTDGAASRSASDMISSLDYLLYESTDGSTYTLAKRVEIPDISTDTAWPLRRETMTWAQREALKDTLNTSNSYKAVFVANADAEKVWDGEIVLTNVDLESDFTEARLNLPTQKSFDASNMYFMDVVEINENRNQADKSSLNKQILLERVINKIEVKLDDEIASAEDLDAYVTQKLGDFYDANYVKDDNQGALDKVVWAYMGDISSDITGVDGITREDKAKKEFRDKFINPDDKRKAVVESIKVCSEPSCTADNYCVKHWLINEMKSIFILHCNWTDIQSVDVEYDKANYPTSIDFYKFYRAESQNDNISVTALKVEDNSYIWYTFGTNGDDTSALGKVSSLKFKDDKGSELFSSSCGKIPGTNLSGGNWNLELVYNPIAAMSVGVADSENPYTREEYNIQNVLGWTWDDGNFEYGPYWTKAKMIKWVNSLFSESESESEFTPYTLSLSIPLISIVDVNSWETGKAGN